MDGLRGFACLLVVLYHCITLGVGVPFTFAVRGHSVGPATLFARGYLAVDIFFALSAFCLAYPLLKPGAKPFRWLPYLGKRVRRIYPTHLIALTFLVGVGAWLHTQGVAPAVNFLYTPSALPALFSGLLWQDGVNGFTYNLVFWTLIIEIRWYILLPVMVALLRWRGIGAVVGVSLVASGAYLAAAVYRGAGAAMVATVLHVVSLMPFFLPVFASGILVAHFAANNAPWFAARRTLWVCRAGLLASVASAFLFLQATLNLSVGDAPVPNVCRITIGAVLTFCLLVLALYDPWAKRLFSWRGLTVLGAASYSIYLTHMPLLKALADAAARSGWHEKWWYPFFVALPPVVCILFGYGFHLLLRSRSCVRPRKEVPRPRPQAKRSAKKSCRNAVK